MLYELRLNKFEISELVIHKCNLSVYKMVIHLYIKICTKQKERYLNIKGVSTV